MSIKNLYEIEKMNAGDRTPAQNEALMMHNQVHLHKEMIGFGIAGLGQDLKMIRDKKLYLHLGFEDFGTYTKGAHGIGERQAYKYIRAVEEYGVEFLHSSANSEIGVTKLLEIAVLPSDERDKVFAEHTPEELAGMSTNEVKKLVAEIADLKKQLSFFENQPKVEVVEQKPFAEIEEEIRRDVKEDIENTLRAEYEERLAELKEKSVTDDEIKKIREDAEKEALVKQQNAIKELKDKATAAEKEKKAVAEKLKEAEDAAKQAKATAEQAKKDAAEVPALKAQIEAANEKAAAAERQIKLSSNPELERFKFMLFDTKASFVKLIEQYAKLDDECKPKMKAAVESIIKGVGESL